MILSEMRALVQDYLDTGTEQVRWSDSVIDAKLNVALEYCVQQYATRGGQRLDEIVTITSDATGSVDLSSYRPLLITSVQISDGGRFRPLSAVPPRSFHEPMSSAVPLRVALVRTPTFPTGSAGDITYGPGISWRLFDECVIIKATRMLLIKDQAELDAGLEIQFNENMRALLETDVTVQVYDFPSGPTYDLVNDICYQYTPYSIRVGLKGSVY